jgi:hypothetical protein
MILGFFATGDFYYIFKDMKKYAIDTAGSTGDLFHYSRMYIFIVGPITFTLFLMGLFTIFKRLNNVKSILDNYTVICIVFILNFVIFSLMTWKEINIGAGTGALRFLIPMSPLSSIIAVIGLNSIYSQKSKMPYYILLIIILLIVFFFLSFETDRTIMTGERDLSKFLFVILFSVLFIVTIEFRLNSKIIILSVIILSIMFTLIREHPITLDLEKKRINEVSEWLNNGEYKNRQILCNHIYFYYFNKIDMNHSVQYQELTNTTINKASKGSIIIWESHYNERKVYGLDVKYDSLSNNKDFRLLRKNVDGAKQLSDGRFLIKQRNNAFLIAIFEKN